MLCKRSRLGKNESSVSWKGLIPCGWARSVQRVFCGHTHEALLRSSGGIEYFNTGSWTQENPTYITVGEEGVAIHEYDERIDDRDSRQERGEADPVFADLPASAGLPADAD